jgi:cell division protein FtsQ
LGFLGKWFYRFLYTSGEFNLEEIDVQGLKWLQEKEILDLVSLEFSRNIFNINLEEARERIEIHPRIKTATLRRRAPNRIIILVEERQPIALINRDGGFLGIDEDYVPFLLIEPPAAVDLPFITGVDPSAIVMGRESDSIMLKRALDILKTILLLKGSLFNQLSEIRIEGNEITLYTTADAAQVLIGKEDFQDQLLKLQGVFIHLDKETRSAEYIDLRFKDKVIVKLEGR